MKWLILHRDWLINQTFDTSYVHNKFCQMSVEGTSLALSAREFRSFVGTVGQLTRCVAL